MVNDDDDTVEKRARLKGGGKEKTRECKRVSERVQRKSHPGPVEKV